MKPSPNHTQTLQMHQQQQQQSQSHDQLSLPPPPPHNSSGAITSTSTTFPYQLQLPPPPPTSSAITAISNSVTGNAGNDFVDSDPEFTSSTADGSIPPHHGAINGNGVGGGGGLNAKQQRQQKRRRERAQRMQAERDSRVCSGGAGSVGDDSNNSSGNLTTSNSNGSSGSNLIPPTDSIASLLLNPPNSPEGHTGLMAAPSDSEGESLDEDLLSTSSSSTLLLPRDKPPPRPPPPVRRKLPKSPVLEEEIIDGFAILEFKTYEDLEFAIKLGQKRKEKRLSALEELTSTYCLEDVKLPKIIDTGQPHPIRGIVGGLTGAVVGINLPTIDKDMVVVAANNREQWNNNYQNSNLVHNNNKNQNLNNNNSNISENNNSASNNVILNVNNTNTNLNINNNNNSSSNNNINLNNSNSNGNIVEQTTTTTTMSTSSSLSSLSSDIIATGNGSGNTVNDAGNATIISNGVVSGVNANVTAITVDSLSNIVTATAVNCTNNVVAVTAGAAALVVPGAAAANINAMGHADSGNTNIELITNHSTHNSITLAQDAGTSDDSGRASERLTTSSVAPRDADSSRDRLSDASSRCSSGKGYICDSEGDDDKGSDGGSVVFPSTPTQVTNTTPSPTTPRKSSDFPNQTGLPLSNGPLGLGGSASPVPLQPPTAAASGGQSSVGGGIGMGVGVGTGQSQQPAPSPAPAALPPPSLPPPYTTTPMQVSNGPISTHLLPISSQPQMATGLVKPIPSANAKIPPTCTTTSSPNMKQQQQLQQQPQQLPQLPHSPQTATSASPKPPGSIHSPVGISSLIGPPLTTLANGFASSMPPSITTSHPISSSRVSPTSPSNQHQQQQQQHQHVQMQQLTQATAPQPIQATTNNNMNSGNSTSNSLSNSNNSSNSNSSSSSLVQPIPGSLSVPMPQPPPATAPAAPPPIAPSVHHPGLDSAAAASGRTNSPAVATGAVHTATAPSVNGASIAANGSNSSSIPPSAAYRSPYTNYSLYAPYNNLHHSPYLPSAVPSPTASPRTMDSRTSSRESPLIVSKSVRPHTPSGGGGMMVGSNNGLPPPSPGQTGPHGIVPSSQQHPQQSQSPYGPPSHMMGNNNSSSGQQQQNIQPGGVLRDQQSSLSAQLQQQHQHQHQQQLQRQHQQQMAPLSHHQQQPGPHHQVQLPPLPLQAHPHAQHLQQVLQPHQLTPHASVAGLGANSSSSVIPRTHSPRGHSPNRERDSYSSNVSSLSRSSTTPGGGVPYSSAPQTGPSPSLQHYSSSSSSSSIGATSSPLSLPPTSTGATPSSLPYPPKNSVWSSSTTSTTQLSPATTSTVTRPTPPPAQQHQQQAASGGPNSASPHHSSASTTHSTFQPPLFAAPLPPPVAVSSASTAPHPFSAESLFQSSKTDQADLLRRELDSRFLDRSGLAVPPTYLRQELHHHQHQHTHLHQHQHQQLLPAAPPPAASSMFPPPLFKDIPKMGAVDSPFYRTSLGITGYPGYSPSLLHPGLGGPTPFVPPSHLPSFAPKQPTPIVDPTKPKQMKTGRWNAMHVRIAWEIYYHQNKQNPDKAAAAAAAAAAASGNSSSSSGSGAPPPLGLKASPASMNDILRSPSHMFHSSAAAAAASGLHRPSEMQPSAGYPSGIPGRSPFETSQLTAASFLGGPPSHLAVSPFVRYPGPFVGFPGLSHFGREIPMGANIHDPWRTSLQRTVGYPPAPGQPAWPLKPDPGLESARREAEEREKEREREMREREHRERERQRREREERERKEREEKQKREQQEREREKERERERERKERERREMERREMERERMIQQQRMNENSKMAAAAAAAAAANSAARDRSPLRNGSSDGPDIRIKEEHPRIDTRKEEQEMMMRTDPRYHQSLAAVQAANAAHHPFMTSRHGAHVLPPPPHLSRTMMPPSMGGPQLTHFAPPGPGGWSMDPYHRDPYGQMLRYTTHPLAEAVFRHEEERVKAMGMYAMQSAAHLRGKEPSPIPPAVGPPPPHHRMQQVSHKPQPPPQHMQGMQVSVDMHKKEDSAPAR